MKKILLSLVFLFKMMYLVIWIKQVESVETDLKRSENFTTEKISENDMSESKRNNFELKRFYDQLDVLLQNNINKHENLLKAIDNYVQRYISLFLITSNLQDHEVRDKNELIKIELEISITGEDLIYLQDYSKRGKDSSYPKNFSKLDAIFSKIASLKKKSFMENAMRSSKSIFSNYTFSVFNNPIFYNVLPFLTILLVTWSIHHYFFYKSFLFFVGTILNSLIIWESLKLYSKKIKEADIEFYVKTLQFKSLSEECDPANTKWYNLFNFFSEDKCLQYHKNINKNPAEDISLFNCIIDTYSFYLIQTPFRIFGASIKDLTGEILTLWPWPVRYFISIPFAPFFAISTAFFILILCGKRLKLSFFGAAVEIGEAKHLPKNEKTAITNNETQEVVRAIRKFRSYSRSKFPKRLEVDSGKRRKMFLKVCKSLPEVPRINKPDINSSDTNLNNTLSIKENK